MSKQIKATTEQAPVEQAPVEETVETPVQPKKDFAISITISDQNLGYKSDFNEAETVFWLESVKALIVKRAFEATELQAQ
jgi:hypothetical protein